MSGIGKALHLLGRENRKRWVLLILVSLVASAFEVAGAALVYLLLSLVVDPQAQVGLPLLGDVRAVIPLDHDGLLLSLAAGMLVFFVLRAGVHVGELYVQNRIAHNAGARLATKVVEGYLRMPYEFHLDRSSSDLIRNSHQAVQELVESIFLPVVRVAAHSVLVLSMLVLLVVVEPFATALAVVVVGGAALIMLWIVQPRLKRIGEMSHEMQQETLGALQQALHGIRDIKVLGREQNFAQRYGKARRRLARTRYLRSTAVDLPKTVMELALLCFILLAFATAIIFQGAAAGALSTLGLFAYAGMRIQPSLHKIVSGLNNLKYASAPLDDLHRDLLAIEALAPSSDGEVEPLGLEKELRLEDVTYRYPGAHRDAIRSVNMTIRAGEVIGICGPTGGGKTTFVDLVTGLLLPTAGKILVDGQDLRGREVAWQRSLGVVPQMVFLTDDTLRRNIALGLSDREIDDRAVDEAVDLGQLRSFVDALPDGLDTVVGERGVRISGGQRQRIAIARALFRRPTIYLFDEGTSALDNTTERELMEALEQLRGDHTILLVAHRLSTVQRADRIVYIENGWCSGLGTYDELRKTHPGFRALAG